MKKNARGFSLLEGLVVTGILLLMAAFALPTVVRGIRTYRLGGAATEVANIVQRARYDAVRRNRIVSCRAQRQGTQWQVWVDANNDGTVTAGEPFILLPRDITFAPPLVPGPASMGYANTQPPPGTGIRFEPRGTVDFGAAAPAVYVVSLGYANDSTAGFRAISVTPTGRTKIWRASQSGIWTD